MEGKGGRAYFLGMLTSVQVLQAAEERVLYCLVAWARNLQNVFLQKRTARRAMVGDKRSVPEDAEESSSETEAPHKPARYASKNMH